MKRLFILFIVLLLCAAPTFACSYYALPLPEMTAQADVIARVRVLSTRPNPRRGKHVSANIATAEIIESLYGTKAGTRIVIDFDAGTSCFDVLYSQGEECIVFLGRSGNVYNTLNFDSGKRFWGSPTHYQALRKSINAELAKLAAPTYRGLRGAKLRAWEDARARLWAARYTLRHKIQNTYRNTTGEKFPLSLDWMTRH